MRLFLYQTRSAQTACCPSSRRPASRHRNPVRDIRNCALPLFQAKLAERSDEAAGPPVNIVFLHQRAHAPHSSDHLTDVHLECPGNCPAGGLDVVRIDNDGVIQFPRCPCKPAKNPYTSLILTRSDVFLSDQIHPVMKRRDHAQMGNAVVALYLLPAVLSKLKNDRSPLAAFETCIDAVGLGLHFSLEVSIPLNAAAGGGP